MSKKEYVNCDDCGKGLVMAERIIGSVLICHCEQCFAQLRTDLAAEREDCKHFKKKAEFDMPAIMQGQFHNACTDPCDMIDGPCACGAWHNAKEWIEKLNKYIKNHQDILKAKEIIIKQLNKRLDDIGASC